MPLPIQAATTYPTVVGQTSTKTTTAGEATASASINACASSAVFISLLLPLGPLGKSGGKGRTKLSGAQSRPSRKARLKFSVARVDSTTPRSSREKDWMRWICCWEREVRRFRAREMGERRVKAVIAW